MPYVNFLGGGLPYKNRPKQKNGYQLILNSLLEDPGQKERKITPQEENHAKAQALKSQGALLALDPLRQDWTEEEELVERVAEARAFGQVSIAPSPCGV